MFSSTSVQKHFREFAGSSSTRAKHDGSNKTVPDLSLVDATCKEQLQTLQRNRDALLKTIKALAGNERVQAGRILSNLNREIGDLHRLVEANSRMRFEEIFVSVTSRRLPKDTFLALVQEARELWRNEGAIADVSQSPRKIRKLSKKAQNHRMISMAREMKSPAS